MTNFAAKQTFSVALKNLVVAEENLRFGEEADEDIDGLALSLAPGSKGQLTPCLVKKTKKKGQFALLDGRRRNIAFNMLKDDGLITDEFEVICVLCESEEEIAAASIVANLYRREASHADLLLTANRLMKENFKPQTLVTVLGVEMKEVKKLLTLASLDHRFLSAYKEDRVDLQGLRAIAKLRHPERIEKLAERFETSGGNFSSYEINALRETTVDDIFFKIVTVDEYVAAGGRTEADLFEESPDSILDGPIATELWKTKAAPAVEYLKNNGVQTWFFGQKPAGFTWTPYGFAGEGDETLIAALSAQLKTHRASIANGDYENDRDAYIATLNDMIIVEAMRFAEQIKPLTKVAAVISTSHNDPLSVNLYIDEVELSEYRSAQEALVQPEEQTESGHNTQTVELENVEIDTEGYSHSQHAKTTTIAGQALALSVANMPLVALDLQISTQFRQTVLTKFGGTDKFVIQVNTERKLRTAGAPDDIFGKPINDRLTEFLEAYKAFGQHPFLWVQSLDLHEKLDLFAQLTAYQVSLAEIRTDYTRKEARTEAAYVAEASLHDIRNYWMPNADYYKGFGKTTLLALITEMGLDADTYSAQKRNELAQTVTELGIEHNFVPAALGFTLKEPVSAEQGEAETVDSDTAPTEDDPIDCDDEGQIEDTFTQDEIDQAA